MSESLKIWSLWLIIGALTIIAGMIGVATNEIGV